MKNVYDVSTKQHGDMKSGVSRSKKSTSLHVRCASTLSCSNMWKSNYPHRQRKCDCFARFLWLQL